MNLLDISPLLGTIVGFSLVLFILFKSTGLGEHRKLRFALSFLIFIFAYTCLDYYLYVSSNGENTYTGGSYLFYHCIGFLFYYVISLFIQKTLNVKKWAIFLLVYSIAKLVFYSYLLQYNNIHQLLSDDWGFDFFYWATWEYFWASLLNIILMFIAYRVLVNTPLFVELTPQKKVHYKWIKAVILLTILFQIVTFINNIISFYDLEHFDFYIKLETFLLAIFFFVFAYSIMHFPVFAFTGNFKDLPKTIQKKYAKSSLTDSSLLFQEIEQLVQQEELYLEYEIKLNTLAEKLDKSVHHISQAINQNANMSFSDYINSYRIAVAKEKLLVPKPDTIFAISLDVGFNSKAAFYAAFKKFTQQTPSEFKKNNKITNN